MRFRRPLLSFLLALTPVILKATNPIIGVDRDPPGATPITSLNFGFGADGSGGGDFVYQNETGRGWQTLQILTTLSILTPTPICVAGPFVTCSVAGAASGANVNYTIDFGPTRGFAIPQGEIFTINLNDQGIDPIGSGSWPADQDFSAKANFATPEPSAGLLTLAGLMLGGGVFLYRRRLLRA